MGAGAEVVAARRSDRFTRFDGNLAGLGRAVAGGAGHLGHEAGELGVVPVRLPHAQRLGGARSREPRGRAADHATRQGSLVHQALEDFIREVLARPELERPGPHEPWSALDRALMVSIGERVCADYERRA